MGGYQAFGDLTIDLPAHKGATEYRRELDLARAVHTITYTQGGISFRREYFCSNPDQVMVLRLTADKAGAYTGKIRLIDAHAAKVQAANNTLTASGSLANGLKYEAQVLVLGEGGSLQAPGGEITFKGCDALTLLLAAGTDYLNDHEKKRRGPAPHQRLTKQLQAARGKSYQTLKRTHVADHQSLFGRVHLVVGATPPSRRSQATDVRLKAYGTDGKDPALEALYFQFGRYLLMGCSRPGSLPANLQGLWNHRNNAPWHSDYHSNINLQMNYWPAETTNLAECHQPLIDMLNHMRAPSKQATQAAFGKVRGWTVRTSHNIFGGHGWKWNMPASAWYCQHLWEHYAFGGDRKYLKQIAYPTLKEVCEFWEDRLKKLPDGTKNPVHGAAVIGDTVGDPCKDTSGPSLNILIKLMTMVSVVFAPVVVKFSPAIQEWLHIATK